MTSIQPFKLAVQDAAYSMKPRYGTAKPCIVSCYTLPTLALGYLSSNQIVSPVGGEHVEGRLRLTETRYNKRVDWNMGAALPIAEVLHMLIYPRLCFASDEE